MTALRFAAMKLGIEGRHAVVCASSRGLGKACARALAEAGCIVVVNGRDAAALDATTREIASATGAKVIPVLADVGTRRAARSSSARCRTSTSW